MRAVNFDFDGVLYEHAETRIERSETVTATVAAVAGTEWFAVFTAADPQLGVQATYVFTLNRAV
jgi:hypothetical protein